MNLLDFISDPKRAGELAARCQTSTGWLWQIATTWRGKRASHELAQRIEDASREIGPEPVPKSSLRPDIWPPEAAQIDSEAA